MDWFKENKVPAPMQVWILLWLTGEVEVFHARKITGYEVVSYAERALNDGKDPEWVRRVDDGHITHLYDKSGKEAARVWPSEMFLKL